MRFREFAFDKEPSGDNRSKLIGTIVQLLKAKKKVDFFVPGIRGHVVGTGGSGDWLTMKRWNKPHSRINYSLALDASDDDRFALKMIRPDYYQVVEKSTLSEEQLDELSFMGSQCTKDCSGHRAGYSWYKRKGYEPASWSNSFNNGAAIAASGR